MDDHNTRDDSDILEAASAGRFGARVREFRKERGMSLEALAGASGVSRGTLSSVERGQNNPSLLVSAKVAKALGVTFGRLLGIEEEARPVARIAGDRRLVFEDPETGYRRELLSPTFEGKGVEFFRAVLPEGSGSGEMPPYRGAVDKYLLVERGRLRVVIADEGHVLSEGDSFYFRADAAHRFENAGPGECAYLVVVSPGAH